MRELRCWVVVVDSVVVVVIGVVVVADSVVVVVIGVVVVGVSTVADVK